MTALVFAEHKAMAEFLTDVGKIINPDLIFENPGYTPSVQSFKKRMTGKRIYNQARVCKKIIAILDTDCRDEIDVTEIVTSNWPKMPRNVILVPFKCELETLFFYFPEVAGGILEELLGNKEVAKFIQTNKSTPFNLRKPSERLEQFGYRASKHLPRIANKIKENPSVLKNLRDHPGFKGFEEAVIA